MDTLRAVACHRDLEEDDNSLEVDNPEVVVDGG